MREDAARAGALGVPARARLYDAVAGAYPGWLTRDQAAEAVGLSRSLAAFHLDKLVEAGLLEVESRRPGGRGGPGAGRPAKHYRRSVAGIELSVPARDYRLAAELLAQAVERGGGQVELEDAAHRAGAEAATGTDVMARLRSMGYDPVCIDGVIRLRNCPFHALAEGHRGVVCDMNLSLLTGLAEAAAPGCFRAELRPQPGFCCVVLRSGGRSRVVSP